MSGEGQQYSRRGITPRALHHIFEQIDIRVDRQMTVRVSFVEVYNEVGSLLPCNLPALQYIAHCSTDTVNVLPQLAKLAGWSIIQNCVAVTTAYFSYDTSMCYTLCTILACRPLLQAFCELLPQTDYISMCCFA